MLEDMDAMQAMKDAMADAKKDLLGDDAVPFDAKQMEGMMKREAEMAENAQKQGQCQGNCENPGQCQGQCQGQGQGQGNQPGPGTGQPGQGGGRPDEIGNQTAFKDQKANSKLGKGRILHQIFVKGTPEKGDAQVNYQKVSRAAKQEAANSLAQDKIPREYEDMVKKYFDSLELKNAPTSQE